MIRNRRGPRRRAVLQLGAAAIAAAAMAPAGAWAQEFPQRALRIIVPIAPGGSVDLTARLVAEGLGRVLGQSVIVENMPGGGGTVGTGHAANTPADGYTMVMGSSSTFGVNPSLMPDLPYDALGDFEPVSFVSYAPNVLIVPASLSAQTLEELIEMARNDPGGLTFASSGVGGSPHLAGELFKHVVGLDILHIPYTGSGQSMADLLAGRVDMSFATVIAAREQIEAGALRPLAVTTPVRVNSLPDVPTMAEAGYPDVQITAWNGLLVPAGTPPEIVARLSEAMQDVMQMPEIIAALEREGSTPVGSTPEEFRAHIAREIEKWATIVREANITIE